MTWTALIKLLVFDRLLGWIIAVQYTVTDSNIQLNCSFRAPPNGGIIQWVKKGPPRLELSSNTIIFLNVPQELRERLTITGDHSNREYNLMISDIKKSDEGTYECYVYGNLKETQVYSLIVIVGPTNVTLSDKRDNKLLGTEENDLPVKCTANGGDPAPNMALIINGEVVNTSNHHTIEHTLAKISRSYDGATVTCQAGYDGITYTPQIDTAVIKLDLKPLTPSFSMNPIVTENTKSLDLTCTSNGSRPAPTGSIWLIGDRHVDITSSSTSVSSMLNADGTYTATSTLTYKVNLVYNQQNVTCGFKNTASGNKYVRNSKRMNVQYAPVVTVNNETFPLTMTSRKVHCVVDSNPASTFSRWQHRSNYGELIRELNNGSTLILPQQSEEIRYQDTGEYICMVNNGIRDESGKLNQNGSGYIVSQAPPRFLNGPSQVKLGQYGKNVDIEVSVYSEPKYSTPTWLKDGWALSRPTKYTMSDVSDVITDTFYDIKVKVDGFRLTLTIKNLEEGDFVNYTLRLSNGVGGNPVEHLVVLLSASPPGTPNNFTITDATDSTITLQWEPAFDGGHEQTFYVEYRTAGSKTWRTATVSKESITLQNESLSYELPGLEDSTSYEIRMFSENKFNKSRPTDTQIISTKASAESTGQGVVIGAVVSAVIVIILVIVAVVIIRRRRDGNGTKNIPRSDSESDEGDGLKDNILYNSVDADNSKPPETTPSEYAAVQKRNDVYAEVSKSKQQKGTNGKKQKGNKLPGKKKEKPKAVNNNFSTEEYANQSEFGNVNSPTGGYKNADGLQYADITFSYPPKTKPGKAGKPVIHGLDDRTIYSDVDHTKTAPPLPQEGAYELTDITKQS